MQVVSTPVRSPADNAMHYRIRAATPDGRAITLQESFPSEDALHQRLSYLKAEWPTATEVAWAHIGTGRPTVPAGRSRIGCRMFWHVEQAQQYNHGYFDQCMGSDLITDFTRVGYLDQEREALDSYTND